LPIESIDRSTIRNLLKQRHVPITKKHQPRSIWRTFLRHYQQHMLACDFFTVETLWLKTVYVLFFIELGSCRVHLAGCTEHPTSAWVTQQARQLCWKLEDRNPTVRFFLHDHDVQFPSSFDQMFAAQQVEVIRLHIRAPNANAFAAGTVPPVRSVSTTCSLLTNVI
jgi:putative transposase